MSRILVIDDEKEIVDILEEFLTKKGFTVLGALGGKEGMEIIDSKIPLDLIAVDLKMPGIKGTDILRKIKEEGIKTPVIILSGILKMSEEFDELKNLGFGEEDVLHKPVDLYELLEKVKDKLSAKPDV